MRPTPRVPFLRAVPAVGQPALPPARSDAELVAAVITGDAAVAGELHDHLVAVVNQTLYRVLGRRESDHDDLIQATFEQVVRSLVRRNFAGGCSLRTWAARIATHVALNALRSRTRERRRVDHGESDRVESAPDSRVHPASRPELGLVRQVLAAMSRDKAEVLVLHDAHGYTLAEIAEMLEVSVAAAQSRLVRGRDEFRSRYERRAGSAGGPWGGTP
jgi:RNA polymerase sigma-70 factor (ECF subfamily)